MDLLSRFFRRHGISIAVLVSMAGLWQILSMIFTAEAVPGEPMVPGWQIVFSRTLLSLSDYWEGGLGVPSVAEGAPRSYLAAILALLSHSFDTIVRLYAGLLLGGIVGALLGLWTCRYNSSARCLSSRWCRCSSSGSASI
jgi:sulfonate transport system permease protein